jgi:hypothetical protein
MDPSHNNEKIQSSHRLITTISHNNIFSTITASWKVTVVSSKIYISLEHSETLSMTTPMKNKPTDGGAFQASNAGSIFAVRAKHIIATSTDPNAASHALPKPSKRSSSAIRTRNLNLKRRSRNPKASSHPKQRRHAATKWKPHKFDVLYGGSLGTGNRHFSILINQNLKEYERAWKSDNKGLKTSIAEKILAEVHARGGQFFERQTDEYCPPPVMPKKKQHQKIHHCMIRRMRNIDKKRPISLELSEATAAPYFTGGRIQPTLTYPQSAAARVEPLPFNKRQRTNSMGLCSTVKIDVKEAMMLEEDLDVASSTTPAKADKSNASSGSSELVSDASEAGSSNHDQEEAEEAQSTEDSASGNGSTEFSPEEEHPLTPSNRMTYSSTMSSISTAPSVRSQDNSPAQPVVEGLFLSPPPAPLKTSKSLRDAVAFNVADTNFLGISNTDLLSPGSSRAWNSFLAATRSPAVDASFESEMKRIEEATLGASPGFMESPIGWPSMTGCDIDEEETDELACSLMNGMMIQSPSLGPYPSPSANLRRVSDATSAFPSLRPLALRQSSTAIYTMGQAQSFTYSSQDFIMDENLKSLRVNLSSIYSDDMPPGSAMGSDSQEETDVLSPLDSNAFDGASPAKKTAAGDSSPQKKIDTLVKPFVSSDEKAALMTC